MSVPAEDERKRRIEQDGGNPNDTVYYLKKRIDMLRTYHENPRCDALEQSENRVQTMPRKTAQEKGWPPCKKCILGIEINTTGGGESKLEELIKQGEVPNEMLGSAYDG